MAHEDDRRGSRADDADERPGGAPSDAWRPGPPTGDARGSTSPAWRPPGFEETSRLRDASTSAVPIGGASASTPTAGIDSPTSRHDLAKPPPPPPEAARPADGSDPWRIVEAVSEPVPAAAAPADAVQTQAMPTADALRETAATPVAPAPATDAAAAGSWPQPGDPVPPVPPPGTAPAAPRTDDGRRRDRRIVTAFAVLGGVAVAAIIVATGFAAGWWGPRETAEAAPAGEASSSAVAGSEPRSDGTRPLQSVPSSPSTQPSASAPAPAPGSTVTRASLVSAVYSAPAPAMCQHSSGSFANGVHLGSSPGGSRAGLHIANPDGSRVDQDGVNRFAATGDLTGDGVPEIAVAAWCEVGGETKPASVLVYTPTASGALELVGAQDLGDLSGTIRAWADTLTISNGVLHVTWDGPWGTTQEKLASVDLTVRGGSLATSGYQESVRAK